MREYIDGAAFREMVLCASDALRANEQRINELNVFPVPDGDTGTNMSLTMSAAAAEMRKLSAKDLGTAAEKTASALLRGARGNSGVILSLLFRGFAKAVKGHDTADAELFAKAMSDGVDAAYKAVMKPTEGTILTVARLSAKAAAEFAQAGGSDLELMLVCALEAAREALAETMELNPVLKRAGVEDAGGHGYVTILDAMLAFLQGRTAASAEAEDTEHADRADFSAFDTEEITFAYDTVFIVRKTVDKPLDLLRAYLDSIGDSLVIGEDDEAFKVHVHTNIPGDALTEAQKYGTLETAKIENMRTQHDELVDSAQDGGDVVAAPEKPIGVVTVCAGEGMESLFRELGADGIVTGGQTMNPSTEDILREINRTPAATVFVLPNNKNIIMAAQQCIPLTEKKVIVIPTKTVPQGVSAMLAMDTYAGEEELEETFLSAIGNVRTALVTYAARDSDFDGHCIKAGEYLGLLDGALLGSSADLGEIMAKIGSALAENSPEFISVFYGSDVTGDDAEAVSAQLSGACPGCEMNVVNGGQPVYYYMISAE